MNDMQLDKPYPLPTPTSQPFWNALREERVALQRCDACSTWVHYPRSHCPNCLARELSWHTVPGNGTLYTFTVTHQPTSPHFADEMPQILAVVELPEGVRLTSTLCAVETGDVAVGMALKPYFEHTDAGITLLRYQPA